MGPVSQQDIGREAIDFHVSDVIEYLLQRSEIASMAQTILKVFSAPNLILPPILYTNTKSYTVSSTKHDLNPMCFNSSCSFRV